MINIGDKVTVNAGAMIFLEAMRWTEGVDEHIDGKSGVVAVDHRECVGTPHLEVELESGCHFGIIESFLTKKGGAN